jgi:hypothetical protein
MDADIHVILDDEMTDEEKFQVFQEIAALIHNEWYEQYSCTVIGPTVIT